MASTFTTRTRTLGSLARAIRAASRPGSPSLMTRLAALPRLLRAVGSGDYKGATPTQLLGLLAAGLYVVSPVDLVPEAVLPVLGIADDTLVLAWLAAAVVNATEDFLRWEASPAQQAGARDSGGAQHGTYGGASTGQHRAGAHSQDTIVGEVI